MKTLNVKAVFIVLWFSRRNRDVAFDPHLLCGCHSCHCRHAGTGSLMATKKALKNQTQLSTTKLLWRGVCWKNIVVTFATKSRWWWWWWWCFPNLFSPFVSSHLRGSCSLWHAAATAPKLAPSRRSRHGRQEEDVESKRCQQDERWDEHANASKSIPQFNIRRWLMGSTIVLFTLYVTTLMLIEGNSNIGACTLVHGNISIHTEYSWHFSISGRTTQIGSK